MFNYPQMDRVFPETIHMRKKAGNGPEAESALAEVLSANLNRLMESDKDLSSNPKLDEKTGLGTSAISRARNGQNVTLKSLAALAKAFDLQPWQLLVPHLEPGNLPVLLTAGKREMELYKRFRTIAEEVVSIDPEDK